MRITSLSLQGFRGDTSVTPLSGIDVFVGPNGSGKTRKLQAVQLGVSGAVPDVTSDKNIETIELFSRDGEDAISVHLNLDGASVPLVERYFKIVKKAGKDSVNQAIWVDPELPIATDEGEKKIKALFGDFPIMLDIHEFIRMSDNKKAELIFNFSPIDGAKWNSTTVGLALKASIPANTADSNLWQTIANSLTEGPLQTAIVRALARLGEMKTALQKSLKENQASSVGTIKSSATDGKSSLRQVEDIESDLSKARAGKDALIESISETKATRQAYNRLIQEKNELTERIDQKRKSVVPPTDIAELKAKIVRMENETSPDTKPVGLQQAKVNTLRDMYSNVSGDLAQKKATLSDARNILRLISNGVCPTCKQKTEGAIESIGSGIETLEAEVLDAETRLKALIKEGETESLKLKSLGDTYNEKLKALEVTKYEASQLKIAIATAEGVSAYLGDMQKKLEELNHTEIDGQMINLDEAELQLTGLNQSISDLTAEMERKRDYDTKVVLAKQTLKKAKEAEATLELVKALTAKLTEIRWTIVKDALEPIRKEASDLFSLSGQKATFDFQFTDRRGNETFRFGWLFKGDIYDTFVEFASLSTAQQLFTIIALLSPLIHRGNPKFRILLLDNVEVLDEKNKVKFLEMLVRAKESYFDNIIVASSAPFEETPTTVTVHQL